MKPKTAPTSWSDKCKLSGAILLLSACAGAFAHGADRLTTLVHFGGTNSRAPISPLLAASNGNFYGTTAEGGKWGSGTAYRLSPEGGLATLFSFSWADGVGPQGGLLELADGKLYGTTVLGGIDYHGRIFRLTKQGAFEGLYQPSSFELDGTQPNAGLVRGGDDYLYGTMASRGNNGMGTIFRMTPDGILTTLVYFNGTNGRRPESALLMASNDDLYGTTALGGGSNNLGTVLKMTPAGALTTLVHFNGTNGSQPRAALVRGTFGDLYGTTAAGGNNNLGTVFRFAARSDIANGLSPADFNNDGCGDLVWQHIGNGNLALWYLQGTRVAGSASLGRMRDTNWRIVATADLNGDGRRDIIWQHQTNRMVVVWHMDNAVRNATAAIARVADPNWNIQAAADLNNDGRPDLIWQHQITGQTLAWWMNGTLRIGYSNLPIPGSLFWQPGAVADVNDDGNMDVFWRHAGDGRLEAWMMNGGTRIGSTSIGRLADTNWCLRNM